MYGYKERKAAQVAAFFALKSGGSINILKLAKLLYLAERESMDRYDEPFFYDRFVSMDHGPVTSMSLNRINGCNESADWAEFLIDRAGYAIGIIEGKTFEDLDDLCEAELKILEHLWGKFSSFDQFQIRDWTHENCPEWENPYGSSKPISHDLVYKFLAKTAPNKLAAEVKSYRDLSNLMETV